MKRFGLPRPNRYRSPTTPQKPTVNAGGRYSYYAILGAMTLSAIICAIAADLQSREALIFALFISAATGFWLLATFVQHFPTRPQTDLLAGSTLLFLLAGAIPTEIRDLDPIQAKVDLAKALWTSWTVPSLAGAAILTLACCMAMIALSLMPWTSRALTINLPRLSPDRVTDLTAWTVALVTVVACGSMIVSGVVSVDKSPYSAGVDQSTQQLGALYIGLFSILPLIPALLIRYFASDRYHLIIRVVALLAGTLALMMLIVIGRRVFIGSFSAAALMFVYQRGWYLPKWQLGICACLLVLVFFTVSKFFLAARESQSNDSSVSVTTMAQNGSLSSGNIDVAGRSTDRIAVLGEVAMLVERLPLLGVAHGATVLTNAEMNIPGAIWPNKVEFMKNDLWNDPKVEESAGNPGHFRQGDRIRDADISGNIVTYSWTDMGILAPFWVAVQLFCFYGFAAWLARTFRSSVVQSFILTALIGYALSADSTSSSSYLTGTRAILIDTLLIVAVRWALNLFWGKGEKITPAPAFNVRTRPAIGRR